MLNINKISTLTITSSSISHFAAANHYLGYGIGKIVREAFEHLFFSQDKTNLSTEDAQQIKPNLIRMKRTTQQANSWPAVFNLTSLNGTNGFSVYGLSNNFLGKAVSSAGDLNGDGITDLVLAANGAESPIGNGNAGAAFVLFGSNASWPASFNLNSLNGTNGFSVYGPAMRDHLGISVSCAGDLNDDGITDLVLGAYWAASPGGLSFAGATYVLFGSKASWPASFNLNSLNGTNGFSVYGSDSYDFLGNSVSYAGDLNGDGITELVLGAYLDYPGGLANAGAAYVLFGSKASWPASFNLTSLNGTNGFGVYGPAAYDNLGNSVSSSGDLNGDGITDLVLGAYNVSSGGFTQAGAAYVLFGSKASWPASFNLTSLNGTNGFSVYGIAYEGYLGNSVSSAGDLNADGITDLVLGAPGTSPGGIDAGAAYVLFGSKDSWPASFNLNSLNGTNGFSTYGTFNDHLGISVSFVGDLNGDGITDFVLGAYLASPGGLDSGAAYVLFGSKARWPATFNLTSLKGTNGFSIYGAASYDELGSSVSSAGDLNGDGITDLVLGAYGAGAAYVLFGSSAHFINSPFASPSMISTSIQTPIPTKTFSSSSSIVTLPSPTISANSPTNSLTLGPPSGSSSSTLGIAAGVASAAVVIIAAGVVGLLWRKKKGCFAKEPEIRMEKQIVLEIK